MPTTDKSKIMVYDSSRIFFRFITQSFAGNYIVDNVFNYKHPERINFEQYDKVLIIINQSIEIFDLLLIYHKAKDIYVAAESGSILNQLQLVKGLKTIELKENKNEIIPFLGLMSS